MELPDAPLSNVELPIFVNIFNVLYHAFLLQVVPVHDKKI